MVTNKKVLDYEQRKEAIDATRTLYALRLIDIYIYEALIREINERTGD